MNRDDVIRMAREAGFEELFKDSHDWVCFTEEIERFAALVAAHVRETEFKPDWNKYQQGLADGAAAEREACVKVCDSISEDQWALYKGRPPYTGKELERASDYTQGKSDGAEVCAAAIRARGQA